MKRFSRLKFKVFAFALALLCSLGSQGCMRTARLYNPAPVSFGELALPDVEAAIAEGALRRGWIPQKVRPGLIRATLHVRSHTATVDIAYNTSAFQIAYSDSTNLNYEYAADGARIHQNYNGWITHLTQDIHAALSARTFRTP